MTLGRLMLNVWIVAALAWAVGAAYFLYNDLSLWDCAHLANAVDSSLCSINQRDHFFNFTQLHATEWIMLPPLIGFWIGIGLFAILRRINGR